MEITIFNSWQSDSAYNHKCISDALRMASMEVEKKFEGLKIHIDEANSNSVGMNHIPDTILLNIGRADIFICDLTVIAESPSGKKKIPNPNVLIELGFALAMLTWDRVIGLVNKGFGDFPELPFDINKRRCIGFKVEKANDPNATGVLKMLLIDRLTDIIKKNPARAQRDNEAIRKRRENDVKTLSTILNMFRVKTMDDFFKDGYKKIDSDIIDGHRELTALMGSKGFILFDAEASARLVVFKNALDQLPKLLHAYYDKKRYLGYENKAKKIKDGSADGKYEAAKIIIRTIDDAFSPLNDYVRQHYHEIDTAKYYLYKFEDPDDTETSS